MSLTTRQKLEKWAEDWCRNDEVPEYAMDLFLDAAEKALKVMPGAKSESLGDYSVSYGDKSALESAAKEYLIEYRVMFP